MPHSILGDHPAVANALATGYPDGEPETYYCPVCGEECECLYKNSGTGDIVGCDNCILRVDPGEVDGL